MTGYKPILLIVVLAMLPMVLGGGTSYGTIAILMVAGGVVLLTFRQAIPYRGSDLLLGTLLISWCLISSLWPAAWTSGESWRDLLPADRLHYFPPTLSPRPWISLESILLLALGAVWFISLRGLTNKSALRYATLSFLALSLLAAGVLALLESCGVVDIPGWNANMGMGPFVNRNQFGFVLALATTISFGLLLQDRRRHRIRTIAWGIAMLFLLVLAVINGSRAGLLLALVGLLAVVVGEFLLHPKIDRLGRYLSLFVITVAILLLVGGTATQRIVDTASEEAPLTGSARTAVHRDALGITLQHPLLGTGFGQFEKTFPLYQSRYTEHKRIVHPESDWLWLTVESGLPVLIILGVWAFLVLRDIQPVRQGRGRRLRWTAAVGAALLFLHGWVEVSGHRPGCVFLGLLMLAFSGSQVRQGTPLSRPQTQWLSLALGALFTAYGAGMLLTKAGIVHLPGSMSEENSLIEARQKIKIGTISKDDMDRFLHRAPLSPTLHYLDGVVHLKDATRRERAFQAFETATRLDPYNRALHVTISEITEAHYPGLADEIRERILSLGGMDLPHFAGRMVQTTRDPRARDKLWGLSFRYPVLLSHLVRTATPEELLQWSRLVFLNAPPENPAHTHHILQVWSQKTGIPALLESLEGAPQWLEHAWYLRAHQLHQDGQFQQAAEILREKLTFNLESLPHPDAGGVEKAQRRLLRRPNDETALLILAAAHYRNERYHSVLEVWGQLRTAMEAPPAYAYWIAGNAAMELERWPEACKLLLRYDREVERTTGER
jgi:O-antigen ligase/tetratricopeptide (TPR) repeat protein